MRELAERLTLPGLTASRWQHRPVFLIYHDLDDEDGIEIRIVCFSHGGGRY